MKIYISSDHGGFELKRKIINFLTTEFKTQKVESIDLGPKELNIDDDFPPFAFNLAGKVAKDKDSLGILICRSGNGMVIAANKIKGAYAALCFTPQHAHMARRDDNANILCLDADYGEEKDHLEIIETFIKGEFAGLATRYGRRFKELQRFEDEHCK